MTDGVRFILDGDIHHPGPVDPTLTVLRYLREHLGRFGTKEGCAEGDCGACTVVIGELVDGKTRYRAVNACIQFLPTLDGKQLITVEGLKDQSGELHPVQQAWIDGQVPQCGYCQSGQIMSAVALLNNNASPTDSDIDAAMSGNVCRCGTYGRIRDGIKTAASTMQSHADTEASENG